MNSNTMDLMELLVQNPNSLSREDLEKLCEAINRESLDSASTTSTYCNQTPVPVSSSANAATIPSRHGSAFSHTAVIHSTPKPECEKMDSSPTTVVVDPVPTGPEKYTNFRPITVTIPHQKVPPLSHMACGDGRHTFHHNMVGIPAFSAKNIVSSYGNKRSVIVCGTQSLRENIFQDHTKSLDTFVPAPALGGLELTFILGQQK